jgi:hypothetical protein
MRGLAAAFGVAALVLLSWTYPGAVAVLASVSHTAAGLAAMAFCGWSVLCVILVRVVHAGVSSS